MKFIVSLIATLIIILSGSIVNATRIKNDACYVPTDILVDSRIETINEHAFLILNLREEEVDINYGDRVELVFGFKNKITIYNISGSDNKIFTNKNEFVAFIDPEYLRCFSTRKLKKIIIYSGDEALVIKTNLAANQLKIK